MMPREKTVLRDFLEVSLVGGMADCDVLGARFALASASMDIVYHQRVVYLLAVKSIRSSASELAFKRIDCLCSNNGSSTLPLSSLLRLPYCLSISGVRFGRVTTCRCRTCEAHGIEPGT